MNKSNRFVVAVSGGVDSVVLLDALANNRLSELVPHYQRHTTNDTRLVIAHFDHGVRPESATDAEFVGKLAKQYNLQFVTKRVALGPEASEDEARTERYKFLRQCCKEEKALLLTAHHQDDVVETAIINLIRGTGWRGLAPMVGEIPNPKSQTPTNNQKSIINNQTILRPLLSVGKAEILAYAKKYNLTWQEDSTNTDQKYLRNYVRQTLLPKMITKNPNAKQELLRLIQNTSERKKEIATELQKLISSLQLSTSHQSLTTITLPRYPLIMYPPKVSLEFIYVLLTQLDPNWHPTRLQLMRALHFIKVGRPGKELEVSGYLKLALTTTAVQFKNG